MILNLLGMAYHPVIVLAVEVILLLDFISACCELPCFLVTIYFETFFVFLQAHKSQVTENKG